MVTLCVDVCPNGQTRGYPQIMLAWKWAKAWKQNKAVQQPKNNPYAREDPSEHLRLLHFFSPIYAHWHQLA